MEMVNNQESTLSRKEQWQAEICREFEQLIEDNQNSQSFTLEEDFFDDEKQEDKLWMARTGLDMDTLCGAIETIIFMSDRPVAIQKIKALIDSELPLRVIHQALEILQDSYEVRTHGIRLVEVAQGYQFRTKATFAKYVQDLFKVNSLVLTPSALEVLAIIAYKQPVSKSEVGKIRGVDSSHLIKALMDKRLVKIVGRSDELGHPSLYGTTPEFLEVFNLSSIDDLPAEHELEDMIGQEEVGRISDIKSIVSQGDKRAFVFDEMEELEQLAQSIKQISSETPFTKNLKLEEKKRTAEDGGVVKSAFELLEEFVAQEQVKHANLDAVNSNLMVAATTPEIVSDPAAGPFNLPEIDDDFQMVDLDTGEIIDSGVNEDARSTSAETLLLDGQEDELDQELSDAFAKLLDDRIDISEDSLDDDFAKLEDKLSEVQSKTAEQGSELDLDLSFLQGEEEENISQELPPLQ